jgi:hypothetical protein
MKPANRAPIYAACCYPDLAEICRSGGYALAIHGSLARDFDLVAIPWDENTVTPQVVIERITEAFAVREIGEPEIKAHGRLCYTLSWMGEAFMDFSFTPTPDGRENDQP